MLGGAWERLGARASKLRHHPAPVRDEHDLSGGHLAEIRAEPVLQLPHGDGLHGDKVAAQWLQLQTPCNVWPGWRSRPRVDPREHEPAPLLRVKVVHASCPSARARPARRPPARLQSPGTAGAASHRARLRHPRLKAFSASATVIIRVMGASGETAKPQLS